MGLIIQSRRLRIEACSAELALAAALDRELASRVSGLRLHPQWPESDMPEVLKSYARALDRVPSLLGFGVWLLALAGEIVGDAGFKGPPRLGVVEIGYSIVPALRGRGLATEAAGALCQWALARGVRRIEAECDAVNLASRRVLANLGMSAVSPGRYALDAARPET